MTTLHPAASRITAALVVIAVALALVIASVSPPPARAAGEPGLLDPNILEVHEGNMRVSEDGAVVENLEIRGELRIAADNVLVKNVWVYTPGRWTVYVESGSATLQNMEIGHPDFPGERGLGGDNLVAVDLDIHHVEDGVKLGSNTLYDGLYVHDLDSPNAAPHADAVQSDGGTDNAVIRNSTLDSTGPLQNGNAAVILKSDLGPITNVTISNSYLNGGNYTVYVRDGGDGMPSAVTFSDNRIGSDHTYGLLSADGFVAWENNIWHTTGEPAVPGSEPSEATTTSDAPVTTEAGGSTTSVATAGESSTTAATGSSTSVAAAEATSTTAAGGLTDSPEILVVGGLAVALLLIVVLAIFRGADAWRDRREEDRERERDLV